jgi:TonB family protein
LLIAFDGLREEEAVGEDMNKRGCLATVMAFAAMWVGMPTWAADGGILSQLRCGPKFSDRPFYHPTAVQQRQSGVVLVEFSVNAKGRAERALVLEATAPELLQSSALQVVKNFKCNPGKEWADAGGPERRVKLNVVFKIDDEEAPKLLDADAEAVTVAIAGKMRR